MSDPSAARVQTPQPDPSHALDRFLIQGLAWTGAARGVAQFLRWASTLWVARLLAPADYGLIGMATVYVGLAQLVNELGLGAAIVQRRDLEGREIGQLGGLSLLAGFFFCAVSVAVAVPLGRFYEEPRVGPILLVLSLTFVIRGVQVVPRALLSRTLQYRRLATIDGVEAASLAGATLLLATLGYGYWALVYGIVVATVVGTLLTCTWSPVRPRWPRDLRALAATIRFGWQVVVSRLGWYVYSNADFAVVGRVLGAAALGAYSFGWSLANIPVEKVSVLVGRVTPGVFASVQHDVAALRRYLLGLTEAVAFVTFPVSAGLALVAEEFVLVLLGEAWSPAVMPLRLLALYAGFRSITTLFPQILFATGNVRPAMMSSLVGAVMLPISFYVGAGWGTTGVAVAWIVAFPLVVIPYDVRWTLRILEVPVRLYLRALWPALSGTSVMVAGVWGAGSTLPTGLPVPTRLLVEVIVGACLYAAWTYRVHGARLSALGGTLRPRPLQTA